MNIQMTGLEEVSIFRLIPKNKKAVEVPVRSLLHALLGPENLQESLSALVKNILT